MRRLIAISNLPLCSTNRAFPKSGRSGWLSGLRMGSMTVVCPDDGTAIPDVNAAIARPARNIALPNPYEFQQRPGLAAVSASARSHAHATDNRLLSLGHPCGASRFRVALN